MLIRITSPHFCAGIDWPGKYPPILRYMKGWDLDRIARYCAERNWKYQLLGEIEDKQKRAEAEKTMAWIWEQRLESEG